MEESRPRRKSDLFVPVIRLVNRRRTRDMTQENPGLVCTGHETQKIVCDTRGEYKGVVSGRGTHGCRRMTFVQSETNSLYELYTSPVRSSRPYRGLLLFVHDRLFITLETPESRVHLVMSQVTLTRGQRVPSVPE